MTQRWQTVFGWIQIWQCVQGDESQVWILAESVNETKVLRRISAVVLVASMAIEARKRISPVRYELFKYLTHSHYYSWSNPVRPFLHTKKRSWDNINAPTRKAPPEPGAMSVFFSLDADLKSLWFLRRWHEYAEVTLRGYLHTRAPFSTRQSFSIPPRHPLSSTFCGCRKSKAQTQSLWAAVICCEWRIKKNITIFYNQLTRH